MSQHQAHEEVDRNRISRPARSSMRTCCDQTGKCPSASQQAHLYRFLCPRFIENLRL